MGDSAGMDAAADIARAQRVFEDALNIDAPAPDIDIVESGLIDSLGLVSLLFELEREFGVQVPLETLEVDSFRTIANIVRTIAALKPEAAP
jgi:D-alanine--poly(phosphoribitol) ligase subunit 2